MNNKKYDLYMAEHNRYTCSYCNNRIKKASWFFRNAKYSFRNSHIINICDDCITTMSVIIGITPTKLNKKRKELIVDNLE